MGISREKQEGQEESQTEANQTSTYVEHSLSKNPSKLFSAVS